MSIIVSKTSRHPAICVHGISGGACFNVWENCFAAFPNDGKIPSYSFLNQLGTSKNCLIANEQKLKVLLYRSYSQ
jgi:hypothetical protein